MRIVTPGITTYRLLDIPSFRSSDDGCGFYVAGHGTSPRWKGFALYQSRDGGRSFKNVKAIRSAAIMGAVKVDRNDGNELLVIVHGTLESVASSNPVSALIGSVRISYTTVRLVESLGMTRTYRILDPDGIVEASAGDRFIVLDESVVWVRQEIDDTGKPLHYKAVSFGMSLQGLAVKVFTFS